LNKKSIVAFIGNILGSAHTIKIMKISLFILFVCIIPYQYGTLLSENHHLNQIRTESYKIIKLQQNIIELNNILYEEKVERLESSLSDLYQKYEIYLESDEEYPKLCAYIKKYRSDKLPDSFVPIIAKAIIKASNQYGFSISELTAVIQKESNFLPWAKSNKNAIGLSQVNRSYWEMESKASYYDIYTNVSKGAEILRNYIKIYGWDKGISTYNMGPKYTNNKKYNWRYVKSVKRNMKLYDDFIFPIQIASSK